MSGPIDEWNKRKEISKENHLKLVKRLSRISEKKLNPVAEELHDIAFEQINCLNCANCCKSIPPILNGNDVSRISKYLGLKTTDFENKYTRIDEDGDRVMVKSPCIFLEPDNMCRIYEVRPKACREYPHTGNFEFFKNLKLHAANSQYCPAVFFILEKIKNQI
ncbi:MAG: YkgJ family cysteine cluster protein [Bacteroidales bacterium]